MGSPLSPAVGDSFAFPDLDTNLLYFIFPVVETKSHCVAQAILELVILWPQPLEFWDYKGVPPCLADLDIKRIAKSPAGAAQLCSAVSSQSDWRLQVWGRLP